jgi:HAD superfamily hydrolase (TIGR01509 family)
MSLMNIGKHKIELVIFDMDGVMFDTEKIACRSWKALGRKYKYGIDDGIFAKTVGLSIESTGKVYKKHFGAGFPFKKMKDEQIKMMMDYILSEGAPVKEGVNELLIYIKNKNLKIALATSALKERAELLLKMSDTRKYFDAVTCGDEITDGKPDPEIFLKTAEKLNCKPENCLVLEDSENGIKAAHRAGMLPVLILDFIRPGKEIESMIFKKFSSLKEAKKYFEDNLMP